MLVRCRIAALLWLILPARLAGQSVADHVDMGAAALHAHDLRTGLAHFEAALALDSTDYAANWRAAVALLDQGELIPDSLAGAERDSIFARAETLAYRAVAADSLKPEGHFALAATVGRASLGMGKKERIRRARIIRDEALRTIELDSTYDGAYHVLGRWNAEIMRLSGLSRFFARSFLGAGIFRQASWEQAIANLQKAVELDPARIYHRLELARIYADRKRYQEARDQLAQIEALPDRELLDPVYRERAAALAKRIGDKT
ncbi:MAG TPA: tetratricopeptide repeat protein [Gemmatimonadales bacterium]|jgi:tetratricopeptide (TPR) repeat protein|nr:tetratricopeptide repeat protein [Gemmatimonadales bacterium]